MILCMISGPLATKVIGCYVDNKLDRDLPYAQWGNAPGGMTRPICARHCFQEVSFMYRVPLFRKNYPCWPVIPLRFLLCYPSYHF